MSAPQRPLPRNRLGAVTFVVAVIGAVFAAIPATAAFGGVLCLIAIIPAIVSFRRVRKGTADNHRQSVAALVLAPVFFIVAVGLSPSPPTSTTAGDTTPLSIPASTPGLQQSSPAITPLPALAPAPALVTAPVFVPAPVVSPAPALAPETAPAPTRTAAPVPAPTRAAVPAHATAAAPASPVAPPNTGSSCDEATHYINSNGNCVLRPVQAATPPPGATAKCVDSTYSSSQHRQGTCSKHGGVAQWL
jgi:hypothetical protein